MLNRGLQYGGTITVFILIFSGKNQIFFIFKICSGQSQCVCQDSWLDTKGIDSIYWPIRSPEKTSSTCKIIHISWRRTKQLYQGTYWTFSQDWVIRWSWFLLQWARHLKTYNLKLLTRAILNDQTYATQLWAGIRSIY